MIAVDLRENLLKEIRDSRFRELFKENIKGVRNGVSAKEGRGTKTSLFCFFFLMEKIVAMCMIMVREGKMIMQERQMLLK